MTARLSGGDRDGDTPRRSIRVPDSEWDAAKQAADAHGETLSDVTRDALRRYATWRPVMSEPRRLDGFDPDEALEGLRRLRREIIMDYGQNGDWNLAAAAEKMAELFGKLDHWLILDSDPPTEWGWPGAGVAGRAHRRRPKRTARGRMQA